MDIAYLKSLEPFFGAWYLSGELGEGSFGKVFEISSRDMNSGAMKKAALKVISIPQNESELQSLMSEGMSDMDIAGYYKGVVQDVVNEYAMMDRLKGNRFVVNCEDYAIITRQKSFGWDILIRMELLNPLVKRLDHQEMEEREVLRLGIDLCHAIEGCENANIIHRDIKPENIFVSDYGEYKLGDFGIARTIERTTGNMSKKGTYTYMAPEIYQGKAYGRNVDLYSIGMVLYRLMNKNRAPFLPPFPAPIGYSDKENALIRRMRGENLPAPVCGCNATQQIILRATAYNPMDRYARAAEMRADLELALSALNKGTAGGRTAGGGNFGSQNYHNEFTNGRTSGGQNYYSEFTNGGTAGGMTNRTSGRTENGGSYVPIGDSIYRNGNDGGYINQTNGGSISQRQQIYQGRQTDNYVREETVGYQGISDMRQNNIGRGINNDNYGLAEVQRYNEQTSGGSEDRNDTMPAVPTIRTTPQNKAVVLSWMIIVSVMGAASIGLGIVQIIKYGLELFHRNMIINAFSIPIALAVFAALASMFRVDAEDKDKKKLNNILIISGFSVAMIGVVTEMIYMLGIGRYAQMLLNTVTNRMQCIICLLILIACACIYGMTGLRKFDRKVRMIIAIAEIAIIMGIDVVSSFIDIAEGHSATVLLPNVITVIMGIAGLMIEILLQEGNKLTAKRIWTALAVIVIMVFILAIWFGPVNMTGLASVYMAVAAFWCKDGVE